MLVAPEGAPTAGPGVGEFKKGAFRMAMAARVPIVPIVIRNVDDIGTRASGTIRPGTVDIVVLPPIPTGGWTQRDLGRRIAAVRQSFVIQPGRGSRAGGTQGGSGVKHRELCYRVAGTALFAQARLPERDPRGIIVISHGLAEHGGRYTEVAARLVASGYAVYVLDHRGHGRSAGRRANVDRFAYLVSDLGTFAGRAQRQHPGAPVFLLGHSMGGAIALACALRYTGSLKGLVLSAPALARAMRCHRSGG
jgi:hypothetical protein